MSLKAFLLKNSICLSFNRYNINNDCLKGLMQEAADEAGLELNMEMPGAHTSTIATASGEQDELSQRLAQLRQT